MNKRIVVSCEYVLLEDAEQAEPYLKHTKLKSRKKEAERRAKKAEIIKKVTESS